MPEGLFGPQVPHPTPTTHLDPPETPVDQQSCSAGLDTSDPAYALHDSFRHSGWKDTRQRIYRAMYDSGLRLSRLGNFSRCGSSWWIQRHKIEPERFRVVLDRCHDRFCTPCAVDRRETIRRNLSTRLASTPHRFLTFTIRHHHEPLRDLINRLARSFRKLRQRSFWRERVTGGAAFLEVTYNIQTRSWHPHLHVVCEGRYIPSPDLRTAWLEVTGDSRNVDISLIRSTRAVIDYVCKYATKPLPATVTHQPAPLAEAVKALSHRRTIITFGRWRHWRLTASPDDTDWSVYAHVDQVRYDAVNGDPLADRISSMIPLADPHTGEFVVDLDVPPPDE